MKYIKDPFLTNHYYYVYNKTVGNKPVFAEPKACEIFISSLLNKKFFHVDILAYCLLPDSYHFLLSQRSACGIQSFLTRTVNRFARFEKRARSVHLSENQLAYMTRYIHMNPFATGLIWSISDLEQYPWSSYWEYISSYKFLVSGKEIVSENPAEYKLFVESQE